MKTAVPAMKLLTHSVGILFTTLGIAAQPDLTVLPPPDPKQPMAMLQTSLEQQCFAALDRREAAYEKLKTPDQIALWQKERREFFVRQLGGFPERTPLNAQVTGKLDRGDYTI